MSASYESCSFCPQLCRHLCPVAVATGHEAATPPKMMAAVLLAQRGRIPPEDAARAATLCTDCGACERHCKYGIEVPALLAQARARYASPATVQPVPAIQGNATLVALYCDERRWGPALADALGQPVATMATSDHLGQALLEHRDRAAAHLASLNAACSGHKVVCCCSRCGESLDAAKISWVRLETLLPPTWDGPVYLCHGKLDFPGQPLERPPTCCGAHGPLEASHPALAADVARDAAAMLPSTSVATPDSACRNALRGVGADVRDPIDLLLAPNTPPAT